MNNEYKRLVEKARKEHLKLTQEQYNTIINLYIDIAKDLKINQRKANSGSLTQKLIKDYKKAVKKELSTLNKLLYLNNKDALKTIGQIAANIDATFFINVIDKFNLNISKDIKSMFYQVPTDVIAQILTGNIYKDGKSLNARIWTLTDKTQSQIDYMISKGFAQKKSYIEMINDVSAFLNPEARKSWDWKKLYPNLKGKRVDYNAQRLIRTSINHANHETIKGSAKRNPFVEAIHWELSKSHDSRQVLLFGEDECDVYAKQNDYGLGKGNFPINEVPSPHPQCLCHQYPEITKSLDQIGLELRNWLDGSTNNNLDEWYEKYAYKFVA